jgi:anti-anti-sigma factor
MTTSDVMNEPPAKSSDPRIEVDQCDCASIITLLGEHDVSTRRSLHKQIERVARHGTPVIVDLSRAKFIDSTIISELAVAHQNGYEIALVAPAHYEGTRLVELIGIGTIVPTYPTRDAAMAAFQPPRS